MESNNVYETPKAESLLDDRLYSFGGWLRFYQMINIISVVFVGVIVLAVAAFEIMGAYEENELKETFIYFFEFLPDFIIPIMILRILKIKDEKTPDQVVKFLGYYVAVSLLLYGIYYYLFETNMVAEKPVSFWSSVIYYFIWSSYFKKSKRVKAYYGANAI